MSPLNSDSVINKALPIDDFLYHLWFDRYGNGISWNFNWKSLEEIFWDTTHVCMGGSPERAKRFAHLIHKEMFLSSPDISIEAIGKTERFSLFKVGNIISVSHGMWMPSMSILLHEISKLLYYAKWENEERLKNEVKFIRIGTSWGIGVDPWDVIVTDSAVNPKWEKSHTEVILGKEISFPTVLDKKLNWKIISSQQESDTNRKINIILWNTLGTSCFYEWQARLDGFFQPWYTEGEKMKYLENLYASGVRNFEMESTYFASFCLRAGISGAIVCVALLNRLKGDQVSHNLDTISQNAEKVILNYLMENK